MFTLIQTPTPNITASKSFYEKLDFEIIDSEDSHYAVSRNLCVEINKERFARAGVKFVQDSWESFMNTHEKLVFADTRKGQLTISPEGCCVYLETTHALPNINLKENEQPIIGTFSGLSLETIDFNASLLFWSHFGFKQNAGNTEHGWISLINEEGFSIGLMKYNCCPHMFFTPSLSFFNGTENMAIIENIRSLKIPITEEITHFNKDNIVDNIIIQDQGRLGYFLFSD